MAGFFLKIYNTQSKEKEKVGSLGRKVKMYACGPTIYNFAHIGNFRTYIFEDLLRRTLEFFGFSVDMVMNITDVDDKTIQGAIEKKIPLKEYTTPFLKAFFEDIKTLNIKPATQYPLATKYIDQMITIILDLIQKGYAYTGKDGSIYFSVSKFSSYGKLSHLDLKNLQKGASERVHADEYDKDQAADFVLWKAYDQQRDGKVFWESPFGLGRPGWHIECSAMALTLLGTSIDIHCGGVDNIFPHHENEIAQSECHTESRFVKVWAHAAHLLVDGKKMSKSLGNFYTIRDLLDKGYTKEQIRYMLVHTHYRTPLNFTIEGIDSICSSLKRIQDFIDRIRSLQGEEKYKNLSVILSESMDKFSQALADDLNISLALSHLFDFIRMLHQLCDGQLLGREDGCKIIEFLEKINLVLGFLPLENKVDVPKEVIEMSRKREEARKNKDWALADAMRNKIISQGYKIEDGPEGPIIKKN